MSEYQAVSMYSGEQRAVFGAVVLLHLLMGYSLYAGLTQKIVRALAPAPLNVREIVQPREAARIEPTAVEWSKPTLYVPPPPDPVLAGEPDPDTRLAGTSPVKSVPEPTPAQPRTKVEIGIRPDPKHPLKIGSEFYPDGSVRAGEQGRCTVQITVDIGGQVTHASLQSSTGFHRLDDACLNAVRGVRMMPATEDGKPIEKTTALPIVWTLLGR
ncbi:MAG TPA: TonB family protein [Steroidobacteraceae bacterium]|jgi:protein TonB|nr:TonB family protein [Steroidobacteraceae bacterium]